MAAGRKGLLIHHLGCGIAALVWTFPFKGGIQGGFEPDQAFFSMARLMRKRLTIRRSWQ
jgi:hypothetical protein